ncbi:MAG TPA: 5-(carboxyamino)imidazole ribonucleotide synthase [Candidatus Saccharimonadales bacterium]|nr:5-(carboxyamino)imidazole ribonucleotide synthase [Candidatus Saccharimonadales bacterium]
MSSVKTIGIVGGGQLGRMLTQAAVSLGFQVAVVNPSHSSPAAQVGAEEIVGDLYDETALRQLGKISDVLTVEIEHLDADILGLIAKSGTPVHPSPDTIRLIQDKYRQKIFLKKAGIPVAPFIEVKDLASAKKAFKQFGGKFLLKTKHGAYDGRGNALITSEKDLAAALEQFADKELYAEAYEPFKKELAVIVARSNKGDVKAYPVVETIHERNICVEVHAPADISEDEAQKATELAGRVAKDLKGAGIFAIEMFLTEDGEVLVNEIAPRVHNSGHFTIEACKTSQFEQHIRAITGMPLGSTDMKVPAAVMINILGERDGDTVVAGLEAAEKIPNTFVHIYGKSPTKIDRKMGHITSTGKTIAEAQKRARQARKAISV